MRLPAIAAAAGCCCLMLAAASAKPVLTGDTSKPEISTFAAGEPVTLRFNVKGAKPGERLKLNLVIVDEHGAEIQRQSPTIEVDGTGRGAVSVEAPREKLGFYRVKAELADGTKLAELGSRKAGFITYAVVPPPSQRTPVTQKEAYFGMQGGYGPWKESIYPLLGIHWLLDGNFDWKRYEPDRAGQFTGSVSPAEKSEWKTFPLPTLFMAPKWAVVPETFSYNTGTLTPEGEAAWDAYCRKAVKAFNEKYPDLEENIYQITWEPVQPWGFKGKNEDLVRIYEIAYKAIHETDPKAVVAGPTRGLDKNDVQHTPPLFQLGLGNYIDAFSIHPYYSLNPERDGMVRDIRQMREGIRRFCSKDLPFLGTEQGFSTHENPEEELNHARGLMRQNLITMGEGFRLNFLYYIVDYRLSEQHGYGYYYALVPGIPWAPAKIGPKPIAPAFAAQSLLLEGHKSAGAIEWLGETTWGYAFERKGRITLALWDFGDEPRPLTLPTGVDEVSVFDWMGNERKEKTSSGNIAVKLGPEPIYIRGVSPIIWSAAADKPIRLDQASLKVFPGGKASLRGTVKNVTGKPLKGALVATADPRLGIQLPQQEVTLEPDASQPLDIAFDVPASAIPSTYAVKLVLEQDQTTIGLSGATIELGSPASISEVRPAYAQGKPAVAVTLRDDQGQGIKGRLVTQYKGRKDSAHEADVEIPPGGTRDVIVPAPANIQPWMTYSFQSAFRIPDGPEINGLATVNFLAANRLPPLARVDGSLSDWSAIPPIQLTRQNLIRSPQYHSGESDLNADVRWAWDAKALYLAVEVTDDKFHQPNTDVNTWRADCLQIGINLDPLRIEQATGNLLADVANKRRVTEISVALTESGPEVYRHISYDPEKLPVGLLDAGKGWVDIRQSSGRLVYELAIPWSELGADQPPKANDLVSVALTVNDSDEAGQKDPSALGLFGGIAPRKDDEKFGFLVLAE